MKKKAFTVVELLVVIAIIAMLLTIMIPALSKIRDMAIEKVATKDINSEELWTKVHEGTIKEMKVVPARGKWDDHFRDVKIIFENSSSLPIGGSLEF
jgi:prepilin-type N-terminal cleavage/methylation domain-containing protein